MIAYIINAMTTANNKQQIFNKLHFLTFSSSLDSSEINIERKRTKMQKTKTHKTISQGDLFSGSGKYKRS